MTVCRYFQQGRCRYGASCRYEHPGAEWGRGSTGNAAQNPREKKETLASIIETDLTPNTGRPLWIFSTYSPDPKTPGSRLFGGDTQELSFEEMRARHYEAVASGMPADQAVQEAAQLHAGVESRMRQALQNSRAAAEYVYNQQVECARDHDQIGWMTANNRRGVTSSNGGGGGGGGLLGNPFAQQPQQPQQPNPFMPSTQTPFGQPAPQQQEAANPFAQNKPQQQQPAFGQPSFGQPSFGQPSFGQPSFGQPSFGAAAQPSFGQSGFGQPAGGGTNPNPFLPALQQKPPAFGQPAFGGQQAPGFGQPQQSQQPNPFAQPAAPVPAQPPAPGQAPVPPPPGAGFGVGSGFGNNPPPAPFGGFGNQPKPQPSVQPQPQQQQQNPFQANNAFSQPNTGANPFAPQPFGAPPQPNPFGQPAPAPAPAGGGPTEPAPITAETAPAPVLPPVEKLYDVPANLNTQPKLSGTTKIDPNTKRLSYFKGQPVQYVEGEPRYRHPDFPNIYVRVMLPHGRPPPQALRDAVASDEKYTPEVVELYKKARKSAGFEAGKVPIVPPKPDWCDFDL